MNPRFSIADEYLSNLISVVWTQTAAHCFCGLRVSRVLQVCRGEGDSKQEVGRRKLQQRFFSEPRTGRETAAAADAHQEPDVSATGRQRGRPTPGKPPPHLRPQAVAEESDGRESAEGQGAAV